MDKERQKLAILVGAFILVMLWLMWIFETTGVFQWISNFDQNHTMIYPIILWS
jgi:hypothetical protein